MATEHPIVLFDGVCNLCNRSVQFIIQRDPEGRFRFASLQSDLGVELRARLGIDPETIDSVILVEGDSITAINRNGELCDRWGTPFFFHAESAAHMEIRSAGPDKKMWTDDDVAFSP